MCVSTYWRNYTTSDLVTASSKRQLRSLKLSLTLPAVGFHTFNKSHLVKNHVALKIVFGLQFVRVNNEFLN